MKKASAHKLVKRRNGKFSVKKRGGGLLHGEEKTRFLQEAGKVKKLKPKAKDAPAAPAEGAPA